MVHISSTFREMNTDARNIFNLIQKYGPLTKNELSTRAGMSLTTLIRTMQVLEETGIIVAHQIGESSGGRKPILYNLSSNRIYCIGIDISRLYTQIVLTNLRMEPLDRHRFEMTESSSPEVTVETITEILKTILQQRNINHNQILGIGVGTVGPLDLERGIMLNPHNFLSQGWEQVPLKAMLENKMKMPVILDNGTNAAVLLETYFGAGKGYQNVAYFNIGIGIRSAVIASGTLIRSINESEDALAHMVINVNGDQCSCGNLGCVECYATVNAICKSFIAEVSMGKTTCIKKSLKRIDYLDICQAAEDGDELSKTVVERSATLLGIGLANFIQLFCTEMVLLSGPLIHHSKLFYDVCTQVAAKRCHSNKGHYIQFNREGAFDLTAMAIGSASLVLKNHLTEAVIS